MPSRLPQGNLLSSFVVCQVMALTSYNEALVQYHKSLLFLVPVKDWTINGSEEPHLLFDEQ